MKLADQIEEINHRNRRITLAEYLATELKKLVATAHEAITQRNNDIAAGKYLPGHEPAPNDTTLIMWDDWAGGPVVLIGAERLLDNVRATQQLLTTTQKTPN